MSPGLEQADPGRPSSIKFNVLGPVTVADQHGWLNVGGPKQRTVLAMLIANAGRPVSNDTIAEAVYPDEPPDLARRRVQTYVSTLRAVLGESIVREGRGWSLQVVRDQVDAYRFEDLYRSVRDSADLSAETAGRLLREALSLWYGHPYSDVEAHGLLTAEQVRLGELRVAAQAARIEADLSAGRHAELIGEIYAMVSEHPYVETFRAQHMLALYRAGRQREALRSYRDMRELLVLELGIEPSPELQALEQRILEQDETLEAKPRRRITRKAVLAVDPGDPIELARLAKSEREDLLVEVSKALRDAIGVDGSLLPAGAASYAMFDTVQEAVQAAQRLSERNGHPGLRMAIDSGDVETTETGVAGVPVSRASVLVSVAHRGQVLMSAEAQQAVVSDGGDVGLRFESLGRFELVGVEGRVPIFQLLVGNPPITFPPLDTERLPARLPGGGDRSVPGYELRNPIGVGSVGILHRAYQPSVSREVMIEVIGRDHASDADFVLRFEADAQRLAVLDHPNVSPLLDYWRDPEGAYLVYRYHRGGLMGGRDAEDPERLLVQIGSALAYAHSYGLVHGSLRPDRVSLDESGNAYLLGFRLAGVNPGSSRDFPTYVAPEVLAGEPPTVATDVYSLGVLARESLGGRIATDADSATFVASAILKATSEEPNDRYPTIEAFLTDLLPASDPPDHRLTEARNPYKGLTSFSEADAQDFFGRTTVVEEFLGALDRRGFLAVIGPSGVGKSSAVKAGLIPRLRQGALSGSERWAITEMLPGSRPFDALQRALERVAVAIPDDFRHRVADQADDSLDTLNEMLPGGTELMLVIDQFEELFTMTPEPTASAFLELLSSVVNHRRAWVVITLRADFLDKPLRYSEFARVLTKSMVVLRAPNTSELKEVITLPARGVGVQLDPTIVERLVAETHDHPGGLPLLQDALVELFANRTSNLIGSPDYDRLGGVTGSIARRAEKVYEGLSPVQQERVIQVFLRLVTVLQDSAPTRKRIPLSDLDDLDASEAVDAFAAARMLVFDNDALTRSPTVELAHEALLKQWPRLAGWIESVKEDLTSLRRLDEAVNDWKANQHNHGFLLSGARLSQHDAWTTTTSLALRQDQRDFLAASIAREGTIRSRSRRLRGLVLTVLAGMAALAIGFAVTARQHARVAEAESLAAHSIVALASDPELALLLAMEAHDKEPSAAALSAVRGAMQDNRVEMIIPAAEGSAGIGGAVDPSGARIVTAGFNSARLEMWTIGADSPEWTTVLADDSDSGFRAWSHLWFSEDGRRIYVPLSLGETGSSPDQGVYTVDAATGRTIAFLAVPCMLRVMPAGRQFAAPEALWAFDRAMPTADSGCDDLLGRAGVMDIETGEVSFEVELSPVGPPGLSVDGGRLVSSSYYPVDEEWLPMTRVFDTTTGDVVFETELMGGWDLSPDGDLLLVGQNPTFLYDLESGQRLQTYQGDVLRASFTPDGTRVIGAGPEGVRIFDTETGAQLIEIRLPARSANTDATGQVMVGVLDRSLRAWDIASPTRGDMPSLPVAPSDETRFRAFALNNLDGYMLIRRGRVKLSQAWLPAPHQIDVVRLEDEATIASYQVWNAELGPNGVLLMQPVLDDTMTAPSGATGAHIGPPRLISLVDGSTIAELDECDWYWLDQFTAPEPGPMCAGREVPDFSTIEIAADGSRASAATARGAVAVWDLPSGGIVRRDNPSWGYPAVPGWGSALSPDGRLMIQLPGQVEVEAHRGGAGERPVARVIDVDTGVEVARLTELAAMTGHLKFHAGSGLILGLTNSVGYPDGVVVIDPEDNWSVRVLTSPRENTCCTDVAISPDGLHVAAVGSDESVFVWDTSNGRLVTEMNIRGWVGEGLRGITFEDDETVVVAPEFGTQLLRLTLDPDQLLASARSTLRRGFTEAECVRYGLEPCPSLDEIRSRR